MREENMNLCSSIMSAIFGIFGVVSIGETAKVAATLSYFPAIVTDKIKQNNEQISFTERIEKQLILALNSACDSTENNLYQENAKNLFHLAAVDIKKVCETGSGLEEIMNDLYHALSELQKSMEKNSKYEDWITFKNLKEISNVYYNELHKTISRDYHELGLYLVLTQNAHNAKKNEERIQLLESYERRIEEIESYNQKEKNVEFHECQIGNNEYDRIFSIINKYYFSGIKKSNSSLYLLEINNNLFPDLSDDIGIKYVDNYSNEIPLFQFVTDNWIDRNVETNLLLTAEGGMGKTVSLFKCCELILNKHIMCIYIPLYRMDSLKPDNIEKFILKYVFRNDKSNFNVFYRYINEESIRVRLVLLLDGFNEVSDDVKNVLIKEIQDFLILDNVRLIITSRYDFRYNYGLIHQFKHLIIQQLSEENILNYLKICEIEISDKDTSLLELLSFPLLLSIYAQTEKYYVKCKFLSYIEWIENVNNAGGIIWNYLQCQILKPLFNLQDERICHLSICVNYIVPYISWHMILHNKFFLTEGEFIEKLNESLKYYEIRWIERKPLIIQRIEMLNIRENISWESKHYYKLLIDYIHLFSQNTEGEYSLIHHRFRDCFGAIFLINEMKFLEWKGLPYQFKDVINNDVLDFIGDLVEADSLSKIWTSYKHRVLNHESCELKNVYYIMCKKNPCKLTFANLDLRNVLIRKKEIQSSESDFEGSFINYSTFIPNELNSSILCMCVLKKREICICGLSDYTIRIWGINYGTFIYVLKGHKGKVTSIACSPNEKICLSGSEDCTLILWDIDKGKSVSVLTGHKSEIKKIEFIDNTFVRSFSADGIVRTWNVEKRICINSEQYEMEILKQNRNLNIDLRKDGKVIIKNKVELIGHKKEVFDYVCIPEQNKFVTLSLDKSIKIWDVNKGKCLHTLTGFSEWENVIDISYKKKICVSGAYDETIRLWDLKTQQCKKVLYGHTDFLSSIKLTHDASKCISGSYDNTAKIWDLATGKCLFTLTGHTQYVRKVICTKDDKFCITASYDGLLKVWEINTGNYICDLKGHVEGVRALTVSDDGKYCLSGSRDFTAKLWRLKDGKCLQTLYGHSGHIRSVKIVDNICLTSGTDKKIRKWGIESGELLNIYDLSNINMPNPNLAFCYKKDCVVYSSDGKIIIYNYINKTIIQEIKHVQEDNYNIADLENILLTSDGRYCISGSYNCHVIIYDLEEHKYILRLKAIPYIDIVGISFHNAVFESEELKKIIIMSGGLV